MLRSRAQRTSKGSRPVGVPIGIMGGGQLARMMALKGHELGLPVRVLSENASDPAAQVTSSWVQGNLNDPKTLKKFLSGCAVATFESEFMNADLLAKLSRQTKTPIFPRPEIMAGLQDRLTQKSLLVAAGLPTLPFLAVADFAQAEHAFEATRGAAVFKQRRFGYDGYGTFVVRQRRDLAGLKAALEKSSHGFIAEPLVKFTREIAVMVGRSRGGEVARLPFVETLQADSRCLWVKGPVRAPRELARLGAKLEAFLDDLDYVGMMGVELFETREGFVINELAPRVHNSGHYSLDALSTDQFSLHLKAVAGLALGPIEPVSGGFAMLNLLGSSARAPRLAPSGDVHLHWYGKTENRRGRKMGHVNVLAKTPEKALQRALKAAAQFRV